MYSRNEEQEKRKLNYSRYRKLSEKGYSISEETAQTALYFINEDPFGRAYYMKSLGEVVIRDPLEGREYTQEEWANKEFIVDNKTQLINKASADLVVGKLLSVTFKEDASSDVQREWLKEFVKRNELPTVLYESAMRNSALGDQYYELGVVDGKVKVEKKDPYHIDVITDDEGLEVLGYEIAWEIEVATEEVTTVFKKKKRVQKTYVQKKIHYPGKIRWELYEEKEKDLVAVPLISYLGNVDLVDRALKKPHMRALLVDNDIEGSVETEDPQYAYIVEENTGVDAPLLIHWPNYRMFSVFGVSDNGVIEALQNSLNNRETQTNDILDKHADPAMFGDASYLDSEGNLVMTGGGGRYFPVTPGSETPGYLEWGGHVEDSAKEIQRLYKAILDNTEIAAELLNMGESTGGIASGRALMYKLIRSLCMAARKQTYMKKAVLKMILTAQKLQEVWVDGQGVLSADEEIKTDWPDLPEAEVAIQSSIPTDTKEVIDEVAVLVDKGLLSKETGLSIIAKYFEEIEEEKEKLKLKAQEDREVEIEKKKMPDLMAGIPEEAEEPGIGGGE